MFLQRMYNYLYCVDKMACFTEVCQSLRAAFACCCMVCLDRSPHYPLLKKKIIFLHPNQCFLSR